MSKQKPMFVAEIDLKSGVSGVDLEKIWLEEFLPNATELPGWTPTLRKGTGGKRQEQYLVICYFDSVGRANELFPPNHTLSEEYQQWMLANPAWQKLMSHLDYDRMVAEFTFYEAIS